MRGLLDDVASGGERGFAVDALDGVGGRVELALEEALLDVLLGEVFVAPGGAWGICRRRLRSAS